MAKRTFAIVAVFAALLSVTLSVQAQNADEYYWTGARNNTYYFAGNWNVNGAAYDPDEQYNTISQKYDKYLDSLTSPSFEKVCHILTSSGTVNIDFSNLGVASLTVGNGVGGATGTATLNRGGGLDVLTIMTVNKGADVTVGGAVTVSGRNNVPGLLTINGGTFNANNTTTISSELAIPAGVYNAAGAVTINDGGTLSIDGGTFTHSGGTLTSNGNFTNAGAFTQTGGTLTTTSTFTMTDGTFTQSAGSFSVADLTLSGGTMSATTISLNSGSGTFTQSGGTLSSYGNALLITGSYAVNNNATIAYTGTINVTNTVALNYATIDLSTYFTTPGQTITIIQSNVENGISVDPDKITIVGDGWTNYSLTDNNTKLTVTYNGVAGKYYWNGSEGDNLYSTTNNWSDNPHFGSYSPENNCYILSTSGTVNIDRSDLGVTSLTVGSGSLSESAAIANSNQLEVETALTINKGGSAIINGALSISGTLTVEGGTVTANSTTGVSGALNITNGSFNATGAVTVNDHGSVSITGGELTSSAALSVNNGGGLTVHGGTVNAQNATNVAGTLTITSGTYNASGKTNVNNGGTLTVTSGTYNATDETTVNAGGTLTVNGGLFVTNNSTEVSGNLNVSAGALNSSNNVIVNNGGAVSISGSGNYNVHNTTVNAGGSLSYPYSEWKNNVTINGGTFSFGTSGDIKNNGTITYSSGTLTLNGSTFRIGDRGHGTLNIEGGTLTINKYVYLGVGSSTEAQTSGTINQTSGNVTFTTRLYLGWGDWSGTYNLSGNGILTTEGEVGLWNGNSKGVSTFNMTGGTANFKNSGESFTIGLGGTNTLANVFNLSSGTINADNTFAVKYGGKLNVGQSGAGDGVLNANTILINNAGILNLSSGTINLGSDGITNNSGAYTINLSGGTFGNKAGDTGNGWSTSLTANIANGTTVTFAPAADKTITWNGALTGSGGGLTVDGEGTLELTAANTYSGVTTISAGTLKLSGAGTLAGNIVDNGTLEFAHTGTQSFSNVISGTGAVTKTGSGTVTLSGNNTFSGGLTISAGTLKLTDGGTLGNGSVTNNANLEIATNNGMDFSTAVSGTGSLTKTGTGVLRYSGAGTYSGGTTISSGAIRLDPNGSLGSGSINIASGADLRFAGGLNGITISNTITGAGGLTKQGTGNTITLSGDLSGFTGTLTTNGADGQRGSTIKLTGANSNLVNASSIVNNGTLDVSGYTGTTTMQLNKLSGAGIVNIGSKPIILNNAASADSTTFSGVINGTGAVTKTGAGTLKLTQAPAYTGSTTIEAGTLELPGNSTLHNLSGGSLEADGANSDVFVNLTSNANLTLNNDQMTKFIGSITASGQTITKTGDGTLKIYTGASGKVDADSLVVSSGELDFKGYMTGSIKVGDTAPGVFSPGNSIGEATFGGDYILNDNGKLLLEIAGSDYTDNDILIVNGDIVLNGGEIDGDIELALSGNALANGPFTFDVVIGANNSDDISNAIKNAIVKKFDWPFSNITVTQEGTISSSYTGDVTNVKAYHIRGLADANAVPEPSTWALLLLGAAGLLYWRKRKSNK